MYTLAIYMKNPGPAAVYVAETKSWKLVKNMNETPCSEVSTSFGLKLGTTLPNVDMTETELFSVLRTFQDGLDLICKHIVETDPQADNAKAATPAAVRDMFSGIKVYENYEGLYGHCAPAVVHAGHTYVYHDVQEQWMMAHDDKPFQDGTFFSAGHDHYNLSSDKFLHLVGSYANSFPVRTAGDVGTVFTLSML